MGRLAVLSEIAYLTTELVRMPVKFIDKTTPLEKELRLRRDAYQGVADGRHINEMVLPFDPTERRTFLEAFAWATAVLDR